MNKFNLFCEAPYKHAKYNKELSLSALTADDVFDENLRDVFFQNGFDTDTVAMQLHTLKSRRDPNFTLWDLEEEGRLSDLQKIHEKMAKESIMVNMSTYKLNKSGSKNVSIGWSPGLNFTPVLRIWGSIHSIYFDENSYIKLHSYLPSLLEMEASTDPRGSSYTDGFGDYHISIDIYKNIKVYVLQCKNFKIMLSHETLNNLYKMTDLIFTKFKLLNSERIFFKFYHNVLVNASKMGGDVFENIQKLLNNETNINFKHYMYEILLFCNGKLSCDLECLRTNNV